MKFGRRTQFKPESRLLERDICQKQKKNKLSHSQSKLVIEKKCANHAYQSEKNRLSHAKTARGNILSLWLLRFGPYIINY